MKKLLSLIMLCVSAFTFAQNTSSKIPSDASIVATIKGNNLLQLISIEELNNSFMGSEILKEISRGDNQYTSLEDFGFNLKASAHYFFQANDSINYNAFIVPIKDINVFEKFVTNQSRKEIVSANGIKHFKDQSREAVVWNNSTLVMVLGSTNYGFFEDEAVLERYKGVEDEVEESVIESIEIMEVPPPPPPAVSKSEEVEIEETIIESTEDEEIEETVVEPTDDYKYYGGYNNYYSIKRVLDKQWSMEKAMSILTQPENSSILKNKSYLKSLDNKAEATLWVNDFGQLYSNLLGSMYYGQMGGFDLANMYADNGMSAKLFMEEDKMVLNTTYTMSDDMAKSFKKMTSRKLNKKFLKYVNEDRMIGFMSYSMDTKAMLDEYPVMMKNMYGNMPNFGEEAGLGADLFSLLLDEEAVAKVLKGDMLFLLSGISKQEVTYTTYDYNDDYEYVEVEKTKNETIPDFLLMASTDDPSMFNKLINYGVNKQVLTFGNGFYSFKTPQSPLAIHMAIKNGIVFVGTSKAEMSKIIRGQYQSKVSSKTKKLMLDNTYSVFVSAKQLASQLPIEEMGIDSKGKLEWFLNTSEDAYMRASKIKGNAMTTEMVVEVPETEENALKYLFNIIETFVK